MTCLDPRPMAPPDPAPAPELVAVWHFLSDDWEHEHWAQSADEADQLMEAYALRADPYTVSQYLVEPTEAPLPEDVSDVYCLDY